MRFRVYIDPSLVELGPLMATEEGVLTVTINWLAFKVPSSVVVLAVIVYTPAPA